MKIDKASLLQHDFKSTVKEPCWIHLWGAFTNKFLMCVFKATSQEKGMMLTLYYLAARIKEIEQGRAMHSRCPQIFKITSSSVAP